MPFNIVIVDNEIYDNKGKKYKLPFDVDNVIKISNELFIFKKWRKHWLFQRQWDNKIYPLFEWNFDNIFKSKDLIIGLRKWIFYYLHYTWWIWKFDYIRGLDNWYMIFKVSRDTYYNSYDFDFIDFDKYYISQDEDRPEFYKNIVIEVKWWWAHKDTKDSVAYMTATILNPSTNKYDNIFLASEDEIIKLDEILPKYYNNFTKQK